MWEVIAGAVVYAFGVFSGAAIVKANKEKE